MSCLCTLSVVLFVIAGLASLLGGGGGGGGSSEVLPSGYTKDWQKVSRTKKQARKWVCQGCKVDCAQERNLVHVHHKDRDRKNNADSNLIVLCIQCHSKQPGRGHKRLMTVSKEDGRWKRIDALRRQQGLSWW